MYEDDLEKKGRVEAATQSLRSEWNKFYDIRNKPPCGVGFEEFFLLGEDKLKEWGGRLKEQGDIVAQHIRSHPEDGVMPRTRDFHDLQSFFWEDVTELEGLLKQYGFEID